MAASSCHSSTRERKQKAKELKELVDHLLWHVSLYSRDRDSTKVVDASIAVTAARAGDV